MKLKQFGAIALASVLAVSTLTGCGGKKADVATETPQNADGKVNLKYYIWSDCENYTNEIVDNYNKSQDKVTVEVVSMPNETYDDKLKVMLSAGSDADIVNVCTLDQVIQFKEAGAMYDITDMVKNSDLDISKFGSMWDTCYPAGQISALPLRSSCWMLFYNADILKEAGIDMSKQLTWDEYGDIAKQLTSGDGSRYGGCWLDWYIYQCIGTQKGTYLNADDITAVKDGIALLNRFLNEDKSHVPLAEVKANDSQYLTDFENGRVAMLPNGEWLINMLMTDAEAGKTDINWEVAPLPVPDGVEAGTTWGAFQFSAIPKDSKYPKESYDFLTYLCGDGGSSVLPKYGMLPAYGGDAAKETFDEIVGKESVSTVAFNAKKIPEAPSYEKYNDLKVAFAEHTELYLYEEKTLDETIANFEAQRQKIMNK